MQSTPTTPIRANTANTANTSNTASPASPANPANPFVIPAGNLRLSLPLLVFRRHPRAAGEGPPHFARATETLRAAHTQVPRGFSLGSHSLAKRWALASGVCLLFTLALQAQTGPNTTTLNPPTTIAIDISGE